MVGKGGRGVRRSGAAPALLPPPPPHPRLPACLRAAASLSRGRGRFPPRVASRAGAAGGGRAGCWGGGGASQRGVRAGDDGGHPDRGLERQNTARPVLVKQLAQRWRSSSPGAGEAARPALVKRHASGGGAAARGGGGGGGRGGRCGGGPVWSGGGFELQGIRL